ncbi:PIN domain-containing protein [Subtercola boreus]|uniref:PIN domain-containing protein n=1 Tax=Subtercola boreus TaxID=120213 RepID=A0A3E0V9X0_9MICO|nr:PIN domain-containing protein [Subtercola boreus]RFA06606.1 PIN domain-containing protein [Subtercola boreus]
MTVTAVYDANVLYPSLPRDLLIRAATKGAVRAKWSELILDEVFRNLILNRPDLKTESLTRTRALMNDAIRDSTVTGHEHLIDKLELPDPDDRHVLAAAIHAQAEVIVTFNLKDFPADALKPHGVIAQHPDVFLTDLFDTNSAIVADAVRAIAVASKNPPRTVAEIVARLDAGDLHTLARRLRTYFRAR